MRLKFWVFWGFMAMLPLTAAADTAYVTDNLRLGLYEAADTSGRPFRMLESGQAMEILTRDRNYANVRKPAKLIVAELTAERDGLIAELEQTKQSFAAPAATIEALRGETTGLNDQLADARAQIDALQAENQSIRGLKEQYRGSLPLSWVAAAIVVCLIAGILLGMWWVDRQSRIRHGGIRIY